MKQRVVLFLLTTITLFAQAQDRARPQSEDVPVANSRAAVLIDATTGTVLFAKNPDQEIPPASLTKLMTMHLALNEAAAGRISLDSELVPPAESWAINQPPRSSLMFLAAGQRTNLRELLLGLAIPSGNDAAVAVALCCAPSVDDFVDMMNREASALGLEKTRFTEPSGISEHNMTTAREFADFCRFYINAHPETLAEYHTVEEFAYPKAANMAEPYRNRPGTIVQYNHNRLLDTVEGVDGLKTGYIDEAGYNIALTAERDGTRLVAVILGAPLTNGERIRDADGERLLEWAFTHYKTVRFPLPGIEPARVWKGAANSVGMVPAEPLEFTAPADRANTLYYDIEPAGTLIAPLPAGSHAGDLVYYDEAGELLRVPLVTAEEVAEGGFFKRTVDSIRLFFQ